MTLERDRELLQTQVYIGHGYNRNAARLILAEVHAAWDSPPSIH